MINEISDKLDQAGLFLRETVRRQESERLKKGIEGALEAEKSGPLPHWAATSECLRKMMDEARPVQSADYAVNELNSSFYAILEGKLGNIKPRDYLSWTEMLFDIFCSDPRKFTYNLSVQVDFKDDPTPLLGIQWDESSRAVLKEKLKGQKLKSGSPKTIMCVSQDCPDHNHSFCFSETRVDPPGYLGASVYITGASKGIVVAAYEGMLAEKIDGDALTHDQTHQSLLLQIGKVFNIHKF